MPTVYQFNFILLSKLKFLGCLYSTILWHIYVTFICSKDDATPSGNKPFLYILLDLYFLRLLIFRLIFYASEF